MTGSCGCMVDDFEFGIVCHRLHNTCIRASNSPHSEGAGPLTLGGRVGSLTWCNRWEGIQTHISRITSPPSSLARVTPFVSTPPLRNHASRMDSLRCHGRRHLQLLWQRSSTATGYNRTGAGWHLLQVADLAAVGPPPSSRRRPLVKAAGPGAIIRAALFWRTHVYVDRGHASLLVAKTRAL